MKILFAASEAVPFIKTGGLGDVVGALAEALKRQRHDVRVVLPKYRDIRQTPHPLTPLPFTLRVPLGGTEIPVRVWETRFGPRVPAYLIDSPLHFERDGVYCDAEGRDFADNDVRYIVFSRAVLELCKAVGFRPDVLHTHDWQSGLVPALLADAYRQDAFFIPTASVFSIHNLAYQGVFPKETLGLAGLSWDSFTKEKLEFYDRINFLKAGVAFSQIITTVSPTYAREVQSEEFGRGVDGFLRLRTDRFFGVLNGLDTRVWNPARDPHLAKRYSAKSLGGRAACKEDLQKFAGLSVDPRAPIFGMVSRLDPQKGFDIVLDILSEFIENGCQAVFLGAGTPSYQAGLKTFARKHPRRVASFHDFNEPLAHKIYGGIDVFLMPSRFEPCGLGQLIALRYGAVPVVTPTGGLKDTVENVSADGQAGVGFVADRVETVFFRDALRRAVAFHGADPRRWREIQKRGMALTLDWTASVARYLELYEKARALKKAEAA
ncbi:MAG: glycogen synthase GlgA [Elusimicrobia bacterium]|jgi:starch synthase|nr:glycogen synthase GlgA [Elusimicrobiota bacterium]MBK7208659.1 glycogen synthase GlgA [Elusimicrobiota bacterium]MBK7545402.1 glycogen synthase GlgA [Elusimicrobiota bacterium]MBK7575581.1 glycogen synthase GlgA [Elusimicrobiota bacterium]MBK7688491.1 glycogen synthase GlgA [Elusimicrobiota bacterium]